MFSKPHSRFRPEQVVDSHDRDPHGLSNCIRRHVAGSEKPGTVPCTSGVGRGFRSDPSRTPRTCRHPKGQASGRGLIPDKKSLRGHRGRAWRNIANSSAPGGRGDRCFDRFSRKSGLCLPKSGPGWSRWASESRRASKVPAGAWRREEERKLSRFQILLFVIPRFWPSWQKNARRERLHDIPWLKTRPPG